MNGFCYRDLGILTARMVPVTTEHELLGLRYSWVRRFRRLLEFIFSVFIDSKEP